jgi:hypothetical protein
MSSPPMSSPAVTDNAPPDRRIRFWLGNAALVGCWLVGLTFLALAVGAGQWGYLWAVMIPVSLRTVMTIALIFRKRPVSDTLAILEGSAANADERQRTLYREAMGLSGLLAIAAFSASIMFLGVAATKAGVTITTEDEWVVLAVACMCHLLLTQSIAMIITARVLSKRR